MSQQMDLKAIERKAIRSYYEDGLWDIFLGALLLAMGFSVVLSDTVLSKPIYFGIYIAMEVVIVVAFIAGKKYITTPRIGHVKLGEKGKARKRNTRIVMAASVLFGVIVLILSIMAFTSNWSDGLPMDLIFPAVYAINMLLVFGLMAHFLAYDRLYLIGVLYALPLPVDMVLKRLAEIRITYLLFAICGITIVVIGLVTFIRFLRANPLPAEMDMYLDENHVQ
jgi:hypothetical protein